MIENNEELKKNVAEEYIRYVSETVKKYSEVNRLISKENEINPVDLNIALASYLETSMAIIAEYQRSKIEYYEISKEYEKWCDEKFIDCRNQMLKDNDAKSIKIAVKEIEATLRYQWKDEYYKRQDEVKSAEYRVSFLRRLVEQYKKFDQVLVTLSSNLRQEMRSISLPDRMNKDYSDPKKEFPQR